jgi:subtilase family serine protease
MILALACTSQFAHTESTQSGRRARVLVTENINEAKLVTLRGNVRPEATAVNDRGAVPEDFAMEHMLLQLQRPPELEKELQQFIDDLHDPKSPNFHKWLTAQQFGERFGVAQQDVDSVTRWLESYGFKINRVYPSYTLIDFSGTASQVRAAFHAEIHHLDVEGARHVANMSDPQIPAALAPVVLGIVSLHDFQPHAAHKMRGPSAQYTFPGKSGGTEYGMVPGDLATIYNLNPLFSSGISGQGQTIALIENTNLFSTSDWNTFRSTFGLSSFSSGSLATVHPGNCTNPGVVSSSEAEAILDAEWASAAAPSAAIMMATCADTSTTFGGLIAVQNLINSNSPPAIMSISYSACEPGIGSAGNAAFNSAYQQAVAQGVSVFVAAGDSGAASCDNSASGASNGISVNGLGSSPYDVAVGGTDFGDTFSHTNSTYWNSTDSSNFSSARSYVPEIPWDNSCASSLIASFEGYSTTYGSSGFCNSPLGLQSFQTTVAAGGGPSACATGSPSISNVVSGSCKGWAKPSWQSVLGNPSDGVRDLPDVSLFAANGVWSHYYIFCWSNIGAGGSLCSGSPSGWSGAGGTSFGTPILAAIQALVNQSTGAKQGNPNPVYYKLAAAEYGSSGNSSCNSSNGNAVGSSCIFYDVTKGDMDVNCTGSNNCYTAASFSGVLSTSNSSFQPAFGTKVGWDFATGIGTINAANLVKNWTGSAPPPPPGQPDFSLSASPSSLTVAQGSSGTSTITITPINGFSGSVSLSNSSLPTGVTANFSANPTTGSSVLTFTAGSTAVLGTVTVTVTGTSGSLTHTTNISLTVSGTAPPPQQNFTLSASPSSVTVTQGSSGNSTITITRSNGFSGSVTLSASGLPTGVGATFSPNPATGSTSTLTLTANSTATAGTANITVTGTSGSLTRTTTISLTVNVPAPPPSQPDFVLSASPGSLTVGQGSTAATTIRITREGGFNSSVFLFALNPPPGVFAMFSQNPATSASSLTFMTFSITPTGTYPVTILGFGGGTMHEINVNLTVGH